MRRMISGATTLAVLIGLATGATAASGQNPERNAVGDGYIVVVEADQPAAVAAEHARRDDVEVRHVYRHVLRGYAADMGEAAVTAVRRDPDVAYLDRDRRVRVHPPVGRPASPSRRAAPTRPPSDPAGATDGGQRVPWGVERVGARRAHHQGHTGEGVPVYVLDTGIDTDHPDLAVQGGYAVRDCHGAGCSQDYDDDAGHGTHVAGTVAALDNDRDVVGVAPDAALWAVKILDGNGAGRRSDVIKGIDWVAGETAARGEPTVANLSLGWDGAKTGACTEEGFTGTDSLHEALCHAKNTGVVVTASAGNDSADADQHVPAAYDDAVLAASAVFQLHLQTEQARLGPPVPVNGWPRWSNWGDDPAAWTNHRSAPVAMAAPGAQVRSTQRGGGTTTKNGTSMAAPHLAGGAALELNPAAQPANGTAFSHIRARLLATAEPTDTASWANPSGNPHEEPFLCLTPPGTDRADCRPPLHDRRESRPAQ